MKQQVLVIHGGTSFDSYNEYIDFLRTRELTLETLHQNVDWRFSLADALGDSFEVLLPTMPNASNARYIEWRSWFSRCLSLMTDDVVLVGHSLGGIFLAKYLSEEVVTKKIKATILLAAPYDHTSTVESLRDFVLPESLHTMERQAGAIYVLHSIDDPVVPVDQVEKYQQALPNARPVIFEHKGHCRQEVFPELVTLLKNIKK